MGDHKMELTQGQYPQETNILDRESPSILQTYFYQKEGVMGDVLSK